MRRSLGQIIFLTVFDAVFVVLSFILAYYLRFQLIPFIAPALVPEIEEYLRILVFIVLVWIAIFEIFGLYGQRKGTAVDEAAAVFGAVTTAVSIRIGFRRMTPGPAAC